jgi:hypothetical protein
MADQSYSSHTRWVPAYHFVLFSIVLAGLIGSCVNLYQSLGDPQRIYNASLIVVLFIGLLMTMFFARFFALKAQDRVIRAEENFRHYQLAGKPLDPRLTIDQIAGLRFASDPQVVALAGEAANKGLTRDEIKKRVTQWRPDHDRV